MHCTGKCWNPCCNASRERRILICVTWQEVHALVEQRGLVSREQSGCRAAYVSHRAARVASLSAAGGGGSSSSGAGPLESPPHGTEAWLCQ